MPPSQPAALWIAFGVIALTLGLLGIGAAGQLLQEGIALAPTPTSTPTAALPATATPDFRATANIEDMITQEAYSLAELGLDTPTPSRREQPDEPTPELTDTPRPPTPEAAETTTISFPLVGGPSGDTPGPTAVPTPAEEIAPGGTPVLIATPTPADGDEISPEPETPSAEFPTATPTWTATPTLTPVGTPTRTAFLRAVVRNNVELRVGPSRLYTQTVTIAANLEVELQGRNASGEWVYLCCQGDEAGWLRQAFVLIQDNELPPGAPTNADPNDARWLPFRQTTVSLPAPPPIQTPIPAGDYPLFRRDPAGQAHIGATFGLPIAADWPENPAQASQPMSSPVLVSAVTGVLVSSQDEHLYSFEPQRGNQRWRFQIGGIVRHAPALWNNLIYISDINGRVFALQDQGNHATPLWNITLPAAPSSGLNLSGDTLLVSGQDQHLYAISRLNGARLWDQPGGGPNLQYPIVGDQLVYAGSDVVSALDIHDGTPVWQVTQVAAVSAPPTYGRPGIVALAELYVANTSGAVYSLDANTGRQLWQIFSGDLVTGMALDDTTLYVSGVGFVKALDRRNGAEVWRYTIADEVIGGPIVGGERLLIVARGGIIQILDANRGFPVDSNGIPTSVTGAPAVGNGSIYVPGIDGFLYAFREPQP